MPYDESDDYDVYEIIDQAYSEADRMSRPIHLLLETYQKYEEHDPNADRVADDREALGWLDDYWEYVKWNEHGNESSIDEVGGFKGFARTVTDSDYVDATLNYLIYEDDPELIDPTARDLADRLKNIANRYGALRKMKKMSFTERVCQYIKNNYDIPEKMEFYIGAEEYDFEDWVDAYVEEFNNNVIEPYGDDSDESDVKVVGDEILHVMTSDYNVGHVYTLNYEEFEDDDDFDASTKKMKKSYGRYGTVEQVHDLSDDERRMYNYKVKLDWVGDSGYVYVWWRIFERDGIYNLIRLEGNGYDGLTELLKEQYFGTLDEAVEYADMQTEIIKNKMLELFGHGMDASWSDNDISSYNNFGDSIKSTKKSQDIHSMIADIRKNNNSLVKNRVDLSVNKYRNMQSVGPDYPLDVDRIVREMLDIIIQSRESNGDYALDEYGAYDEWEKRNYEIVAYDEDGDETYNEEIYDKLEDAFINYRKHWKSELMNKVYDLEYNDLISIAGREVYVKSTNGNDSYNGCKLWCGPNEDDEMGWYFDASDFEGVIRHSGSGDNIWNHSW